MLDIIVQKVSSGVSHVCQLFRVIRGRKLDYWSARYTRQVLIEFLTVQLNSSDVI